MTLNDEYIKESLALLQNLDIPREQRRRHNKLFIDCLALAKGGEKAAFLWMKKNLYQETCELMLDDLDYSGTFLQTTVIWFKEAKVRFCRCSPVSDVWVIKKFKLISVTCLDFLKSSVKRIKPILVIYLDFLKDITILINAMFYLQNQNSELFSVGFATTLTWIFFASLSVPMLVSALETAWSKPFAVLGQSGWEQYSNQPLSKKKLWGIRVAIVVFYLFVPAILTNNREKAREKKERLMKRCRKHFEKKEAIKESLHKKLRSTTVYIEESTKALLIFKSHELSIEKIIQLIIQVTLLLLSPEYTEFPTKSGFQELFDQPTEEKSSKAASPVPFLKAEHVKIFFILSIAVGFYTTAHSYVLIKKEEKKNFLPFLAKCVLGLRSLLVYATRMFCIVVFFGVFLGLLDSLSHWRADLIPEANLDSFTAPPYSNYTGHDITTAFGVFIVLLLVQALAILLMKRKLSVAFKKATWTKKFDHIIDSMIRYYTLHEQDNIFQSLNSCISLQA